MCMLNRRTHILFDDETIEILTAVANQKQTSVGNVVRQAVKQLYMKSDTVARERKKRAYSKLLRWQKEIGVSKLVNYRALINDGRVR